MGTSYQVINSLGSLGIFGYYLIARFSLLTWSLLAFKVHDKYPNFLFRVFRYGIGYAIFYNLISIIPINRYISSIISFVLSIGFIFIDHLNLEKISFYLSLYLYCHMVALGINSLTCEVYFIYWLSRDPKFFMGLTGIVFIAGLYSQYKKQKSQYILVGDSPSGQS
jgi:hypothetical protein